MSVLLFNSPGSTMTAKQKLRLFDAWKITSLISFFQNLAMDMSETQTDQISSILNDPEEPFTAEVEETAVGVAGCLKNVLKSASGANQAAVSNSGESSSSKV